MKKEFSKIKNETLLRDHCHMSRYIETARRLRGTFPSNLFAVFEKRLDVALYRLNFTKSLRASRQAINHQKVFVNHRRMTAPGHMLMPGDVISLCQTMPRPRLDETHFQKKPLHFETSYTLSMAIFLYAPQQLFFPMKIDTENLSQLPSLE